MNSKFRSGIVICLMILSALFVSGNFGLGETSSDEEQLIVNDNAPFPLAFTDYHWGDFFVVSEPVDNQDWNSGCSTTADLAVENGIVYAVWADDINYKNAGTDNDIFFRWFNGNEWSDMDVISEPVFGEDQNSVSSSLPSIAVDNGDIYVVWHDLNDTYGASELDFDVFYRCNLGNGWEDIQVISEPVVGQDFNFCNSFYADIEAENGNIYVVWEDGNHTNNANTDYDIFYRCNLSGSGWEPVQVISEPVFGAGQNDGASSNPKLDVEGNDVYVVWHDTYDYNGAGTDSDIFYRCNRSGSGWDDLQVISEPVSGADNNIGYSTNGIIDVENGKVYVLWRDNETLSNCGPDPDIFFRCNTTGSGWDAIQILSEPVLGVDTNTAFSDYPAIAIENDIIYVGWIDSNDTQNSGTDPDVFIIHNDTMDQSSGKGWSEVEIISEPIPGQDINIGDSGCGGSLSVEIEHGKSYVIWFDNNDTNNAGIDYDVMYRSTFLAPELISPGVDPSTGDTGTGFNFTVIYMDADNEGPTKMIINISGIDYQMLEVNPADTNYRNGKMYYFNTTLSISNDHTFFMQTSDGTYSEDLLPIDAPDVLNTIPVITTIDNNTAYEDLVYEVDYEYEDIDIDNVGQIGTWSLHTDAGWLEINETTGVLSGTPNQAQVGNYWVNVTINDTMNIDSTNFTLDVNPVNDPPSLITDVLLMAQEDEFYEVTFEAEDLDTSKLFWDIITNASWLNVNNSLGSINGTPLNEHVRGEFWVDVMVRDGEFMDNQNFTLIVNNTNDPPEIQPMELVVPQVGTPYSMIFIAEDIDPPPTIFTWMLETSADAWLKINVSTGEIYGTPTENDVGEFWMNVSVNDGAGGTDHVNLTLNVELGIINLNPTITTEDVTYTLIEERYGVDYDATDDRTAPINLTWGLDTNATWLSINASSGELRGIPSTNDTGEYWVNITVYDGEGGTSVRSFTLIVGSIPLNIAPELSNGKMAPASGDTDTNFTFTVTYTDEDGDPGNVSVWIDGVEHEMNPDPSDTDYTDGVDYTYKTKLDEGEHEYYFTGDDGDLNAVPTDTTPTSSTDAAATPSITEAEEDKKEAGEGDENWWIWVLLTFIIMLILVFVAFAIGKRQGAAQAYGPPAEEAPPAEEEPEEDWEESEEEEDLEEWEDEESEEGEDEDEWEDIDEDEEAADEDMDDEDDWDEEDEGEDEEDWDEE